MKTRKKIRSLRSKPLKKHTKRFRLRGGIDRGTIFIVVIMITLMFTAYIFVGGTIPETIPSPRTEGIVGVDLKQKYPQELGLQMHTFQGATITPYPTAAPAAPQPPSKPSVKVDCATTITTGTAIPDIIWAYRIATTPASGNQEALQVFFSGSDPVTIGTTAMTEKPSQHLTNPPATATAKDPNGFPLSAAVFVTDITANPADVSGDAKTGVPQFPSDVYGAWQTEALARSDAPNAQYLGTTADLWPSANGPGGGARKSTWTAELIWKTAALKTNTGAAVTAGKSYRMQIILHSGPQNNQIGMMCATFKM
jgi:hypothetical protein